MATKEPDSAVMATQEVDSTSAFMVARAFVESYYIVLYSTPDIVHKFYEDSSTITRPNLTDGEMSSASTMLGIKEKILSLDYHSCKAEIASIDAQESCNKGIIVLVTGFLIGEGELKRTFTQTFFLAKHATGYFVLNDIFKFGNVIDEAVATAESSNEVTEAVVTEGNQESAQVPDQQAEVKQSKSVPEKVNSNSPTTLKGSVDKKGPILKPVVVSKQPSISSQKQTPEPPKISYASMLAKESPVTSPVKRLANQVVVVAPSANSSLDKKTSPPPAPQVAPPHRRNNSPPSGDNHSDGKGIYVGHLPPNIPAEELEKVFREFGRIIKDGIQIRTYDDGFCYGFVEFESSDAARKAIEAHDFWFGTYKSYVTEKRSSGQAGNGNGNARQAQGKSEYRNIDSNRRSRENSVEGRRDRGDYGQNRPYNNRNRSDSQFQKRGPNEFSNQNRWGNGGGEQKVYQNGGGRVAPTTSVK